MSDKPQPTSLRLAESKTDILVHTLWEHYPEGLPPWSEVDPRIRSWIVRMAQKVIQALDERDEALCAVADAAKAVDDCWGAGTKDRDKLIEHLRHYIAEMHAALAALDRVEG